MIDGWVIKTQDDYYHMKDTIGTFCKDIEKAKEFKDKKSARRDISIKELKRCRPVRVYGGVNK